MACCLHIKATTKGKSTTNGTLHHTPCEGELRPALSSFVTSKGISKKMDFAPPEIGVVQRKSSKARKG